MFSNFTRSPEVVSPLTSPAYEPFLNTESTLVWLRPSAKRVESSQAGDEGRHRLVGRPRLRLGVARLPVLALPAPPPGLSFFSFFYLSMAMVSHLLSKLYSDPSIIGQDMRP